MSYIDRVHARQILDSRGNPTIEVEAISINAVSYTHLRAHETGA